MTDHDPPCPTGRAVPLRFGGSLVPLDRGEIVILQITGSEDYYLPTFTRFELLEATLSSRNVPFDRVMRVTDGEGFLAALPETFQGRPLRVIQDLRSLEDGRVRYFQWSPGDDLLSEPQG